MNESTRLDRNEIRKKINNGTITYDEFMEYQDMVFAILKENYFTYETVPGSSMTLFKDFNGSLIKIDNDKRELMINTMSKYAAGEIGPAEMHKFLFEFGMCMELCGMFLRLMHDSTQLKTIYEQIISNMDAEEVEKMKNIDKSKLN